MACAQKRGFDILRGTLLGVRVQMQKKEVPHGRLLTGPHAQKLPVGYRWLVLKGLIDLCPWYLIEEQRQAEGFQDELLREIASPNISPIKDWFPFARRHDCDDFAGFVIEDGQIKPEVVVIHLTFAGHPERPPWPSLRRFSTLWSWLQAEVIPAWEEWVNEEEVKALMDAQPFE